MQWPLWQMQFGRVLLCLESVGLKSGFIQCP